ncbi:MAG: hypothetical protein KTR15_15715 [Phycisphaeraceae bacterium]|nr:hypothetical protein [Phycisphaeraceae bacterium]
MSNWITVTRPDGMTCSMKVYDTPSKFGIDNGCISKMEIRSAGGWLYNYDRGLDFDELDKQPEAQQFFNTLIAVAN